MDYKKWVNYFKKIKRPDLVEAVKKVEKNIKIDRTLTKELKKRGLIVDQSRMRTTRYVPDKPVKSGENQKFWKKVREEIKKSSI